MRALVYSDWCVLKSYLKTYVLTAAFVAIIVSVGQGPGNPTIGVDVLAGVCATLGMMLTLSSMFACFGAEEQNDWGRSRLELLPVTPRQVVRSRYVTVGSCCVASVLAGLPLGFACMAVMGSMNGKPVAWDPVSAVAVVLATMLVVLVLASLQLPIVFRMGAQRARLAGFLPIILLVVVGMPLAMSGGLDAAVRFASVTPAPVVALIGAGFVALLMWASMLLSERLYVAREQL